MFFIGIFGIDKKNEEIKALHDTVCRECSCSSCTLYREYYRFHFFFIPLITWGKKYRVVCESCGTVFNVSEEKDSYSYWELNNILFRGHHTQPCYDGRGGNEETGSSICPNCGAEADVSWVYCPSCGKKLQ